MSEQSKLVNTLFDELEAKFNDSDAGTFLLYDLVNDVNSNKLAAAQAEGWWGQIEFLVRELGEDRAAAEIRALINTTPTLTK